MTTARPRLSGLLFVLCIAGAGCSTSPRVQGFFEGQQGGSFAVTLGAGEEIDPSLGNPGYDVAHYDITLDYTPETQSVEATVQIAATATAPLSSMNLDFIGYTIDGIAVDGAEARWGRTDRDVTVDLPAAVTAGRQLTVAVRYHGRAAPYTSVASLPVRLGWNTVQRAVQPDGAASGPPVTQRASYVLAEPDGARSWFPCNDVPADKATFSFRVTVPSPLLAAANGVLAGSSTGSGQTTWSWEMRQPMATYLAAVVVGDFEIVNDAPGSALAGVPIRNVLPTEGSRDATDAIARQGEMIQFFSGYFGRFPFDTYGVAYVPDLPGGMEAQTLTLLGAPFEPVVAHELAHSWFGDGVSPMRWKDVWLNEGFATYAAWMWEEHAGRGSVGALAAQAWAGAQAASPPGNPTRDRLFDQGVYIRGGLTLQALRLEIGDDAFFATLRGWFERYAGRSASTDDFVRLAEEKSGRNLEKLFNDWLYGETIPGLPKS